MVLERGDLLRDWMFLVEASHGTPYVTKNTIFNFKLVTDCLPTIFPLEQLRDIYLFDRGWSDDFDPVAFSNPACPFVFGDICFWKFVSFKSDITTGLLEATFTLAAFMFERGVFKDAVLYEKKKMLKQVCSCRC